MTGRWPRRLLLPALLALAFGATPAAGELFRCVRPDGSVSYTDHKNGCAHTSRHELTGDVQTHASPPAARQRGASSRSSAASLEQQAEQGAEAHWRQRKSQAQGELERGQSRLAEIGSFVAHCNRGGEVFTRDPQSGIKRTISCDRVRDEHDSLETKLASLRDYLARGIHEECRRAGCLPGWLR